MLIISGMASTSRAITKETTRFEKKTQLGIVRYINVTDSCIKVTVLHTSAYSASLYTYLIYNKNPVFIQRLNRGNFISVTFEERPFYKRY